MNLEARWGGRRATAIGRERGSAARRRRFASSLEVLESRRLLATFTWANDVDGDFSNPANWLNQNNQPGVPGPADTAIINFTGLTVTVSTSESVNVLTSKSEVDVTGGTLTLANVAANSQIATLVVGAAETVETTGGVTGVASGAISGTIHEASGASTSFNSGTTTVAAGAGFTGAGTIDVAAAGTLEVNANIDLPTMTLEGTLSGSGSPTIIGTFDWDAVDAVIAGATGTTLTVAAGATMNITAPTDVQLNGQVLQNNGTINWSGTSAITIFNGASVDDAGTFNDQNDHVFGANGSFVISQGATYTKSVGTLGSSTEFNSPLTNDGTVNIDQGVLQINQGGQSSSTVNVAAGTELLVSGGNGATETLTPSATLAGTGEIDINGGGADLTLENSPSLPNLELDNGELGGTGSPTITGTFTWTGGTIAGALGTTLTVASGATMNITEASGSQLDNQVLQNNGTINWSGTGEIQNFNDAAVIDAATFNDQNDHIFGGTGSFTINQGATYTKSVGTSATSTDFESPLTNNGTVNVAQGVLQINAGGQSSGTLNVPAGSELLVTLGTETVTPSATLNAAGEIDVNGNTTLALDDSPSLPDLELDNGTLGGTGSPTITGTFIWTGGTIAGALGTTLTIASGATMNITEASGSQLDNQVLQNNGTINWSGTGEIQNFNGAAVIDAGTFNDQNNHIFGGSGSFTINQGATYTKTVGTAQTSTVFDAPLTNNGTVNVEHGALQINAGGQTSGSLNVAAGTELLVTSGIETLNPSATLTGTGEIDINGGDDTTLALDDSPNLPDLELDSGTLAGTGSPTVTGTFTWTGGTIVGAMGTTLTVASGATMNITEAGGSDLDNQVLQNNGTINWSGAGEIQNLDGASVIDAGTFNDQNDHIFSNQGLFTIAAGGTYTKSVGVGNRATQFNSDVNNLGTMAVTQGSLLLSAGAGQLPSGGGTLTGGTWQVGAGATLTIAGGNITTNQGSILLGGPGALFTNIAALASNAGTFDLEGGAPFATTGALSNSGSLIAGPSSTLSVAGVYTQTAAGDFTTRIGGTPASGDFGRLSSTGAAALGGTFTIAVAGTFPPVQGDTYDVMSYPSETGNFAKVVQVAPGGAMPFSEMTNAANVVVTVTPQTATSLTAVSGSGTFGGTATLTATLDEGTTPLANETVAFTLTTGGTTTPVGTAPTNASGVATIPNVSLAQLEAATYTGAVGASFAGDTTTNAGPSSASGNLTVAPATATLTLSGLTFTYSGQAAAATVTVSPPGIGGVTVAYTQNGTPVAAPTQAGSYAVTATLDNANDTATPATGTLVISQVTPVITWANPANISSGTALSATQLDATASVPGQFVYTPPSGTVLSAGQGQALSVMFSPTDSVDYTAASKTVTINVTGSAQTTPTITWANPSGITYGTPLSSTQLDATASVPGTFVYSPAPGNFLNAGSGLTLSVSFTPTDTADFTTATRTVTIDVAQAALTVTAADVSKVYGQPNPAFTATYSGFVNSDSPAALGGALSFSTTANAASAVGSYQVTPGGLTAANYTLNVVPGTLTVTPAPLTIIANNAAELAGQANPALTATYVGFVNGDTAANLTTPPVLATTVTTPSAAGNYPITASGAASPNYTIAYIPGTLTVIPAPPATSTPPPSPIVAGLTALVDTLYKDLLNQTPSAASLQGWLVRLAEGQSPQTVATAIGKLGHHVKSTAVKKALKAALAADAQAVAQASAQAIPLGPAARFARERGHRAIGRR